MDVCEGTNEQRERERERERERTRERREKRFEEPDTFITIIGDKFEKFYLSFARLNAPAQLNRVLDENLDH